MFSFTHFIQATTKDHFDQVREMSRKKLEIKLDNCVTFIGVGEDEANVRSFAVFEIADSGDLGEFVNDPMLRCINIRGKTAYLIDYGVAKGNLNHGFLSETIKEASAYLAGKEVYFLFIAIPFLNVYTEEARTIQKELSALTGLAEVYSNSSLFRDDASRIFVKVLGE